MSKFVGLFDPHLCREEISELLGQMVQAFYISGTVESMVENGIGVAAVSQDTAIDIVHDKEHSIALFLYGEITTFDSTMCAKKDLIDSYICQGRVNLERYDGVFVICLFDLKHKNFILGTDRVGICPCYWYQDDHCIVFASEVKALLLYPGLQKTPNLNSWGNVLSFGYLLGNETLLKDVHRVPPATTIDISESGVRQEQYWDYECIEIDHTRSWGRIVEESIAIIRNAIKRHAEGVDDIVVPLSGGYDSRFICAVLSQESTAQITTITGLNHENGFVEPEIAANVASFLSLPNIYIPTPDDLIRKYFVETVFLTEGHNTNDFIWAMPFISAMNPKDACFDGLLGGPLLRGDSISMKTWMYGLHGDEIFTDFILKQMYSLQTQSMTLNEMDIFRFFVPEVQGLFRQRRQSVLKEVASTIKGPNRSTVLYLSNRTRNTVALGTFNIISRRCPKIHFPYLDYHVLTYSLAIPPKIRLGKPFRLYEDILSTAFPRLMKIPSTNPERRRRPLPSPGLAGLPHRHGERPRGLLNGLSYTLELVRSLDVPDIIQRSALELTIEKAIKNKLDPGHSVLSCLQYIVWHELFIKLSNPRGLLPYGKFIISTGV